MVRLAGGQAHHHEGGRSQANTLSYLLDRLEQLTLTERLRAVTEVLVHKQMASCHLHTVLRTHWAMSRPSGLVEPWSTWRMMDKVEREKPSQSLLKTIRFKSDVAVKTDMVTADMNTLALFSNHQREVEQGRGQDSAVRAAVFKMSSPTEF